MFSNSSSLYVSGNSDVMIVTPQVFFSAGLAATYCFCGAICTGYEAMGCALLVGPET